MDKDMKTQQPRRMPKPTFIKIVKAHTRPGRPAFAALAKALNIALAEEKTCPVCKDKFFPVSKMGDKQIYCKEACATVERQRRWQAKQATSPAPAAVQAAA